jgi:hypothetical protein
MLLFFKSIIITHGLTAQTKKVTKHILIIMKNLKFFLLTIVMMVIGYNTWAQCPTIAAGNISRGTDGGVCTAVTSYSPTISPTTATVTYLFTGATAGSGSGTGSGSTFNKGVTTVKLTVTENGCSSTKTFKVTVNDNEKPVFTGCPTNYSNISFANDLGQCSAAIQYPTITATENCGNVTVTRISGPASGGTFQVGTTNVRWKATDTAGNISLCSFNVNVVDVDAPTITCPANITVNTSVNGECSGVGGTATFASPTAMDECGISFTWLISGLASGSCFPIGTTTNIWKTKDNNNNTATCAFTVTVIGGSCSPAPVVGGSTTPNAAGVEERSNLVNGVEFKIYPNPSVTGAVIIIAENGGSLFSATGQLMSSWNESSKQISNLPAGFYFVKTNEETKSLIVTK